VVVLVVAAFAMIMIMIVIVIVLILILVLVLVLVMVMVMRAIAGNAIDDCLRGAMKGIQDFLRAFDKHGLTGGERFAKLMAGLVLEVLQVIHSRAERAPVKRATSGVQDYKKRTLINITFGRVTFVDDAKIGMIDEVSQ